MFYNNTNINKNGIGDCNSILSVELIFLFNHFLFQVISVLVYNAFMKQIKNSIIESWLIDNMELSFSRSGGPGGQNVNKVNTKVTARINIDSMEILTSEEKDLVKLRLKTRINEEGELFISVSETRSQLKNREIALIRLTSLICGSLYIQKKRKKTRPSKAAREKRLDNKRKISEKKSRRSSLDY